MTGAPAGQPNSEKRTKRGVDGGNRFLARADRRFRSSADWHCRVLVLRWFDGPKSKRTARVSPSVILGFTRHPLKSFLKQRDWHRLSLASHPLS